MTRWTLLLVTLAGICALAQDARPTVAPFPLDIRKSGLKEKEEKELASEFQRLVRAAGAIAPDPASLDSALKELKRQDCDKENECLKQLALKAGTLYAVYVSVDIDYTRTKVVAMGRVVRDDGVPMGLPGQEIKTVSIVKGRDSFAEVSKVAMAQLLEQLGVRSLSPVRPALAVPTDVPRVEVHPTAAPDGGVALETPPTPPPAVEATVITPRKIGWIVAGVGGAAAVAGGVVLGVGITSQPTVTDGLLQDPTKVGAYKSARGMQTAGAVLLSVGLAVAAGGVGLALLSPADGPSPTVSLVPLPGGAAISVQGEFR